MGKYENNKKKIGILGGTFDPAHKGHIKISRLAKNKFNLKFVIWAITKKNPFKNKTQFSLKERMSYAKKINLKNSFIKVNFYEKKIKSNRSIDLINHIKKKYHGYELYFLIGADNLINFHKWVGWKDISQKCNILVFDRLGYKSKSLKSKAYKEISKKYIKFINFDKVNISSSQLRKI